MPTLKKYHHYRLKKECKKLSRYIENIIPTQDLEVPKVMFDLYEDITGKERNG
jgi:hypothetical protein